MIKRHTKFYLSGIVPLQFCGENVGYQTTAEAFELPFEVGLTTGKHDFNKCPNCQETLAELTKRLTERFNGHGETKGFPFCCANHSNLVKIKEFDRALFVNAPVMAAKKIVYTNQHVINNHASENWYKVITHYIDWMVESFGQVPHNCGSPIFLSDYFFYVAELIKNNKEIPQERKQRLLKFLNAYLTQNENYKTDFNVLIGTYEKWFKVFPFELNSYFGNLKQHFKMRFPILRTKPEKNIYSGIVKAQLHTKSSLIESLVNLTNDLLTKINGVALYEMGLITSTNQIKLELIINSRKLKLKQDPFAKNHGGIKKERQRRWLSFSFFKAKRKKKNVGIQFFTENC